MVTMNYHNNRLEQAAPKLSKPAKIARKEEQERRQLILVTTRKDLHINPVEQRDRIMSRLSDPAG